ncbi:MAG: phosphatase PAP2 family protein [Eggerthellaceae bacterium]|nr:phosphatase PAP2 family protein [Eggerthellaceae bacterium]MBR2789717.1 phosphatase PAP2 family protein [Eggerthellaceae bacterium]MBR3257914.1 phosphatase PAP2 family protein [Eggerthellaceae bacterium]
MSSTKRVLIPLIIGYMALMAVFTFTDYSIAQAIYQPGTAFAKVFETIGTIPMPIMGIFACVSFWLLMDKGSIPKVILKTVLLAMAFMYFFFIGAFSIRDAMPGLFIPALAIYGAWTVASVFIARRWIAGDKREIFRKVVCVLLITCVVGVIGEDIIKSIFGRIRFYRLEELGVAFQPWYVIQGAMPFGDRFNSSFPSGHAAKSIMPLALLVLPYLTDKLQSKNARRLVVVCCVIFMLCTWIARMMDGMHYASDVLTGSFIVVLTFLLAKGHFLD